VRGYDLRAAVVDSPAEASLYNSRTANDLTAQFSYSGGVRAICGGRSSLSGSEDLPVFPAKSRPTGSGASAEQVAQCLLLNCTRGDPMATQTTLRDPAASAAKLPRPRGRLAPRRVCDGRPLWLRCSGWRHAEIAQTLWRPTGWAPTITGPAGRERAAGRPAQLQRRATLGRTRERRQCSGGDPRRPAGRAVAALRRATRDRRPIPATKPTAQPDARPDRVRLARRATTPVASALRTRAAGLFRADPALQPDEACMRMHGELVHGRQGVQERRVRSERRCAR